MATFLSHLSIWEQAERSGNKRKQPETPPALAFTSAFRRLVKARRSDGGSLCLCPGGFYPLHRYNRCRCGTCKIATRYMLRVRPVTNACPHIVRGLRSNAFSSFKQVSILPWQYDAEGRARFGRTRHFQAGIEQFTKTFDNREPDAFTRLLPGRNHRRAAGGAHVRLDGNLLEVRRLNHVTGSRHRDLCKYSAQVDKSGAAK